MDSTKQPASTTCTPLAVLPARKFTPRRHRPGNLGTWSGHLPFVNDLIAALRPATLVELGTHYGESYFGMCQAVQENSVSCRCYAVDTWEGDAHAGHYTNDVFEEVTKYNDVHYGWFSKLLRMTFAAARDHFADHSVDLLHIDGLHTYAAVRQDFEDWKAAVRPGGIVLLHDTVARHADFGVWRLWEELSAELEGFEFLHSWGLGVLCMPGATAVAAPLVETLFRGSARERDVLRYYYSLQAEALEAARVAAEQQEARLTDLRVQVFPQQGQQFSESTSVSARLSPGEWQHVLLELPQGASGGRIRVDPANRPCVVEIAGVALRRPADGSLIAGWTTPLEMQSFTPGGDLLALPNGEVSRFLSIGPDPHLLLPSLDPSLSDQPLVLDLRIRVEDHLGRGVALLQGTAGEQLYSGEGSLVRDDRVEQLSALGYTHAQVRSITAERDSALAERVEMAARQHELAAEIRHLQAEQAAAASEYRRVHVLNEGLTVELSSLKRIVTDLRHAIARLEEETAVSTHENARLAEQLSRVSGELRAAYASRSWRLTSPLRWLLRATR